MCLTFSALRDDEADYGALVQIVNTDIDVPWSVEEVREEERLRKPNTVSKREFLVLDEQRIGVAVCMEQTFNESVGGYYLGLSLLPAFRDVGLEGQIIEHLLDVARENGGLTASAYVREDRKGRTEAFRSMGFECIMRDPITQIDLDQFDAALFEPSIRSVEEQGISLRSIAELVDEDVDWLQSAHELSYELLKDVPLPDPPRKESLDEFRGWVTSPAYWFPEGWIVAFDGPRWVGLTDLHPVPARPDTARTGLTGVVRSHRRRGIATSLKVTALARAKKAGIKFVQTGNEENNPMLQLNLRLGFREVYAMLTYRRDL
ncbi:MAG: GNAT family N-acetyltransferase [Fimbriimonadales bacterium]